MYIPYEKMIAGKYLFRVLHGKMYVCLVGGTLEEAKEKVKQMYSHLNINSVWIKFEKIVG